MTSNRYIAIIGDTIIEQDETTINALLGLLAVSRKFWIHKVNRFNEILPYLREKNNYASPV